MSPGTLEAALRAAGGAILAVDEVMTRKVANAFSAVRPPGHHAERATAMGFCFFNNAAVAARHAQAAHGAERVAIVDWDVHHGNGTQDIFWGDRSRAVLLDARDAALSRHRRGRRDGRAQHHRQRAAAGRRRRAGVPRGLRGRRAAADRGLRPDLIIISAGFDAHGRDPLANLNLVETDFAWATAQLMELADRYAGGRLVSVLEGGYDLEGLSRSVAAHVMTLMRGG